MKKSIWLSTLMVSILTSPVLLATDDVNGDGQADFTLWRPSNLTFYSKSPQDNRILTRAELGQGVSGVPLTGDLNGNGLTDFAVWYEDTGLWHIRYDDDSQTIVQLGQTGDVPFIADRTGDGIDEVIVRRPSEGRWYYLASETGELKQVDYGRLATDTPLVGYFDTDARADFAIWRDGTWYVRQTSSNTTARTFLGRQETDLKLPADYDGDGLSDIAIWRPATGTWYIYYSSGNYPNGGNRYERVFGKQSSDIPVPADYDGDGKADLAIRRPATGEFIYLSSLDGSVNRFNFGRESTDIPALAPWSIKVLMRQQGSGSTDDSVQTDAAEYYQQSISDNIVQSRCIACHISGGAADGQARLIFERNTESDYLAINQQRIADFLTLDGVDSDYFLGKASGGLGHIGGTQLPAGSDEYQAFETYLGLLISETGSGDDDDNDNGSDDDAGFWANASILSADLSYRRALLLLTGRVPDLSEMDNLAAADDAALREAILNQLSGDGFHEFLVTAANDKLLTDKFFERGMEVLDDSYFPEIAARNYEAGLEQTQEATDAYWRWRRGVEIGILRAPVELIAHVVENDLPFTEIVTADYMMLNPFTNVALRGDAEVVGDDAWEFAPGQMTGAMIHDESFDGEWTQFGLNITSEGSNIDWPHAGLLNDLAWLNRYPSTATNRNRARSRWTYYHFLDFDIEKSAQRTQDPDALADTNNPTLNNANCTVCHQTLDPIAGAYQDYGDWGNYKDQWGGKDSLPWTYKWPEDDDSLYQEGDTWYRDMLAPGLETTPVPQGQDSIQWLGQQIAADDRFAIAMVKFFWEAILGSEPLTAPQSLDEADYSAKNEAFTEQSTFILTLAEQLREHGSLRQTIADLTVSPWFRVTGQSANADAALQYAVAGSERLLTPEELERKTQSLTNYLWNPWLDGWNHGMLRTEWNYNYNIMYGGIDSFGVTKRARDMTSIMAKVATAHAAEASCPTVLLDINQTQGQRRLFNGIERSTVPGILVERDAEVDGLGSEHSEPYELSFSVQAGTNNIILAYTNDTWIGETGSHQDLIMDHISIYDAQNNALLSVTGADLDIVTGTPMDGICSNTTWNHAEDTNRPTDRVFWGNCSVTLPVEFEEAGDYTLVMEAYYQEYNSDGALEDGDDRVIGFANVAMSVGVVDPINQSSPTGDVLRDKMVELVQLFWGQKYQPQDTEITRLMTLFSETMEDKRSRTGSGLIWEWDNGTSCNFDTSDWDTEEQWGGNIVGQDPFGTLAGWRAVMVYLMTDYQYLHD
ncbi:FG-GAP repeat domain-containing protein [Planctobacterium marinum]|uniref:DUF1588 domain-containing protein n=1 Tax=Planctobacterium marinum TaxID=1631968 RepID=A0AA48KPK3_9ALTE|nr:hypothetical protein MACH26_10440 [Planctobacterium marinum]